MIFESRLPRHKKNASAWAHFLFSVARPYSGDDIRIPPSPPLINTLDISDSGCSKNIGFLSWLRALHGLFCNDKTHHTLEGDYLLRGLLCQAHHLQKRAVQRPPVFFISRLPYPVFFYFLHNPCLFMAKLQARQSLTYYPHPLPGKKFADKDMFLAVLFLLVVKHHPDLLPHLLHKGAGR
jgi:hypothetical protein